MKYQTISLYQLFDSFGVFNTTEIEQILQCFEPKSYTKGTIIADIRQVNDKMYFIEKGMLREFSYQDQDNTISHWLMSENDFVYLVESFFEKKPSEIALEVIENAKLWVISKQNMDKLYLDFPHLNLIGRLTGEKSQKI
ncbi:Crp/Fnr family transcriptional regulator [Emticicia sp.]|uniref:Crp/Fnr family transcriptional regulator n=1 Tax=Emticicia sp. TaxID=1930953 RepID=UPI0037508460